MSAKTPQKKPKKELLERLEAELFIEEPEGPKPSLPKPVLMKLPKGKTITQIVSQQRR